MSNAGNTMTIAEFERLLDIYGAARTRWPVEARASAGQLVARDKTAARLLAEAEALDRALERAPLPSLAQEAAMAERIVAAARRTPRIVSVTKSEGSSNVVALPARARPGWIGNRARFGGLAGALAASLVFGVFIGLSNLSQGVMPSVSPPFGKIHLPRPRDVISSTTSWPSMMV